MLHHDEQASHSIGHGSFQNRRQLLPPDGSFGAIPYGAALLAVALALGAALLIASVAGVENVDLVFLIAVMVVAARYGLGPSLAACVFSVLIYKFFFIPPIYGLVAMDPGNVVTMFFFLVATVFTGHLASLARADALNARSHAATTEALYGFSRKIAGVITLDELLEVTRDQIASMMQLEVTIRLPDADGKIGIGPGTPPEDSTIGPDAKERRTGVDHQSSRSSYSSDEAGALSLPLRTSRGLNGVIGISRNGSAPRLTAREEKLLSALVDQAAVAIERIWLARAMDEARLAAETERLRSALLSSLSHDLKTPLASITGAATSLRQYGSLYGAAEREDLVATIQEEAERLSRFVANLLDMARIEAGGIELKREPVDLSEVVGSALERMRSVLAMHRVAVEFAAGLPMLNLDVVLFEQVLVNLLDNAAKYAPAGSTISIRAHRNGQNATLDIADEGPGIPEGDLEQVFETFYRVNRRDRQRAGTGLGLSICRGLVGALGGTIRASNRTDGAGAVFSIAFPEQTFASAPGEEATPGEEAIE